MLARFNATEAGTLYIIAITFNMTVNVLCLGYLIRCAAPPLILNILFIPIAQKWPGFVKKWEFIEGRMVLRQNSHNIHRYIKLSTIGLAVFRLGELVHK